MSKRKIYIYCVLVIITIFTWLFSDSKTTNNSSSEHIKVALREVGNQLLLANGDSTSLVLPVVEVETSKYEISFKKELAILPNSLVAIVKGVFKKAKLPEYYRVSVIQCSDKEVGYSYEMSNKEENTLIPCSNRSMPIGCYTIDVRFTNRTRSFLLLYALLCIVLAFALDLFLSKKKSSIVLDKSNDNYKKIGSYHFYPEQNKLVKAAQEISLSKKECELLAIFVSNPNKIIKREELTKKVWEDNGVFVGRSLDTYISKLRKKLKEDDAIKLINVHGVGYKLEVN